MLLEIPMCEFSDFVYTRKLCTSQACQIPKIKRFANRVNGFHLLTILVKSFSLDVWQGSEYTSKYHISFSHLKLYLLQS